MVEYLQQVTTEGWLNQLPYAVEQRKLAKAAEASAIQRVPFSSDALVHHLVRFIAANDQVSA